MCGCVCMCALLCVWLPLRSTLLANFKYIIYYYNYSPHDPWAGRSPEEVNGNPLQYSCLENPMDRGTWWATVHGVARVWHNLATKLPPPSPHSHHAVHKVSRTYSFYNWRFVPFDQYLHISLLPNFGYPLLYSGKYFLKGLLVTFQLKNLLRLDNGYRILNMLI